MIRWLFLIISPVAFAQYDWGPEPFHYSGPFYLPTPGESIQLEGFLESPSNARLARDITPRGEQRYKYAYSFVPWLKRHPQLGHSNAHVMSDARPMMLLTDKPLNSSQRFKNIVIEGNVQYRISKCVPEKRDCHIYSDNQAWSVIVVIREAQIVTSCSAP